MIITPACEWLTLARRYQECCQSTAALVVGHTELHAEWVARQQDATKDMSEALAHLAELTGSATVGEAVLSRTNALIRAERAFSQAEMDRQTAQGALRRAAREALASEAQELRAALDQVSSDEGRAMILVRLAKVEQLREEITS